MKRIFVLIAAVIVSFAVPGAAQFVPPGPPAPPVIGQDPFYGPICAGPLGPGPCQAVQRYMLVQQIASQIPVQVIGQDPFAGPICAGPLGPGPCAAVQQYLAMQRLASQQFPLQVIANAPGTGPVCAGPLGPGPCEAIRMYLMQQQLGAPLPAPLNLSQVRVISNGVGGPICAGPFGPSPCSLVAQLGLDRFGGQIPSAASFGLPSGLNDPQKIAMECARRVGLDVGAFAGCAGQEIILPENEQAVLDCAVSSADTATFANCAAPHLGIRLSDDQRILAQCAMKSKGERDGFLTCAGGAFLNKNLTPDEQAVLSCAANAGGDASNFASCSATHLLGAHLSREQQIALQCAAQSQGDMTAMATCAGANMFNLQLNPEQQIAIQCVVSTGGQPYAAAGCIASRLTARELTKCMANGIGGDGCFGDSNDLVGRNGWTARTLGQIAGGPNSVFNNPGQLRGGPNSFVNNPGQIWGGDNSFVRNPGQIFGGSNSFVRNPSQFWGGNNSVFNNPGQLLPKPPPPVQIGSIGGKRICFPWC